MSEGRIRVLVLIGQLELGGSERQLLLTMKHLDRARFEPHVAVLNRGASHAQHEVLREMGVPVWTAPEGKRGPHRRLAWLYPLCRRLRPRVLHSWTAYTNPYAVIAGRAARVPRVIGSLRGTASALPSAGWPGLLVGAFLRGADRLVVNADALREEATGAGTPPGRIVVIPNGVEVDTEAQPADLAPLGVPAGAPVVLQIGNLRTVKNHGLFIRAMARVRREMPEAVGMIVGGESPSEPTVRAELEALDAEINGGVVFAGFRRDVSALLRRANVLTLTSHSEGMPNVVLEAMAMGVPVVAVRVGGVAELVVDGVSGETVEPGAEADLAAVIAALLADPTRASKMGEVGRKRAAPHGAAQRAEQFATLYEGFA
ncbi:MAG: glycosyltransferase [Bacteroidota bacterium]